MANSNSSGTSSTDQGRQEVGASHEHQPYHHANAQAAAAAEALYTSGLEYPPRHVWTEVEMADYFARMTNPLGHSFTTTDVIRTWTQSPVNNTIMSNYLNNFANPSPPLSYISTVPLGSADDMFEESGKALDEELIPLPWRTPSGQSLAEPGAIMEYGREYHGWKQDKYFLPVDAFEQDRLDLQHKCFELMIDEKLSVAPLGDDPVVLDIATGTGIWAIEFADRHPYARVIASDLNAIQPSNHPLNCEFVVREDAEADEWLYNCKFDYIHLRAVLTCFDNPDKVARNAYENLEPGGWIEYQDAVTEYWSNDSDGSTIGTYMERFCQLMGLGFAALGREVTIATRYKQMLIDAGFVDVQEQVKPWPLGGWSSDQRQREIGRYMAHNVGDRALGAIGIKPFKKLGMTNTQINALCAGARMDLRNRNIHGCWTYVNVIGRKPFEGELESGLDAKRVKTEQVGAAPGANQ